VCRELGRHGGAGEERFDVALGKPPVVEWVAARYASGAP
jgi:hypothetical protein